MVFIAEPLRNDLEKLLRILLIAAYPGPKGIFQRLDKRSCRDCLAIDGPLVETIQHLLQRERQGALL